MQVCLLHFSRPAPNYLTKQQTFVVCDEKHKEPHFPGGLEGTSPAVLKASKAKYSADSRRRTTCRRRDNPSEMTSKIVRRDDIKGRGVVFNKRQVLFPFLFKFLSEINLVMICSLLRSAPQDESVFICWSQAGSAYI